MVNYLRNGKKPPFADDGRGQHVEHEGNFVSADEKLFYNELDFWQIPHPSRFMSMGWDDVIAQENFVCNEFDADWAASTIVV